MNDFIIGQFKTLHEEYVAPPRALPLLLCVCTGVRVSVSVLARARACVRACARACLPASACLCLRAYLHASPCLSSTVILLPTQHSTTSCSNVLFNYIWLGRRYIAARASVPAGQLLELPYAELEADKLSAVARCYEFFGW